MLHVVLRASLSSLSVGTQTDGVHVLGMRVLALW